MDENQNENVKIDYEAMLQAALTKMKSVIDEQEQYFKYLYEMDQYTEDIALVSKNLMFMSLSDQLALLKAGIVQGRICQELQKKYKFEKENADGNWY